MSEPIRITGLDEFRRNLKTLDGELPKALRQAGNKAAELVVDKAKPRVPVGPAKGGHASDSIRAASTQGAARVRGGGKRFAYYPWLDFGGRVGPKRSVKRPFLKTGRYIWAAYANNTQAVWDRLAEALIDVARQAGVEVDDQ